MIYKFEINIIVYPVQFSHLTDSFVGNPKEFWVM